MQTFAIGDIHGCNRTFRALLKSLPLHPGDRLILLGDLIDRGPASKQVIDTVFSLRKAGHEVVCIRGNHEQLLLETLHGSRDLETWLFNGGRQTLESFGVQKPEDIPVKYLRFFQSMPFWFETMGYLCVHGGLDFTCADPLNEPETLLWMRRWYDQIDYGWLGTRIVLHGHTPESLETIRAQYDCLAEQQYLNLDNGCVYARLGRSGNALGRLLAFCVDTRMLHSQTCQNE